MKNLKVNPCKPAWTRMYCPLTTWTFAWTSRNTDLGPIIAAGAKMGWSQGGASWDISIPEKGFRMIRYYGFLANRVRSTLLPKVFALLEQKQSKPDKIRYRQLLIKSFNLDPLICILCESVMVFSGVTPGKSKWELFQHHDQLAQQKIVR